MDFFILEELKEGITFAKGIGIDRLTNIYKILGKSESFKTLESISPYHVIYLEEGSFPNQEGLVFSGKYKKEFFALVTPNSTFQISYENKVYFSQIYQNKLVIYKTMAELEKHTVKTDLSAYSDTEKKAYHWLGSNKTGLSSLTMCKALLPDFKHHLLDSLYNHTNTPYEPRDNADFQRCLYFFESVPELKIKINELNVLSPTWNKLVAQWDHIENLILTNQDELAYEAIKECHKSNKPKLI